MTDLRDLREFLELLCRAEAAHVPRPGFAYGSTAAFVLEHGVEYAIAPEQPEDRMAMKHCFSNSYLAAVNKGLRYCEGYAIAKGVPLAVHHAWNLNRKGEVVDATWGYAGAVYFGVEFGMKRVADALTNGTGSVLDDWQRRNPVLRERWQGEEAR